MRTLPRTAAADRAWPAIVVLVALAAAAGGADAQRRERSGKEVVDAVCASCHAEGKDKAPRIGDAQAWAARAAQGLTALTEHALKGIRGMPPHGGNPGVSDIEIERSITYIVNQSGGRWIEPLGGATPAVLRTSESVVQSRCAACHAAGLEGAPKIGDREAWIPRLRRGLDALVASAVHGHGAMPARGGMPDLSDQELRGAVVAMFSHGVPASPPPPAPVAADPNHKIVSGTDVYFGVLRADAMRGAAAQPPRGKGYYHLNISLADNKTQVPVTDAQVRLRVSDGMSTQARNLGLVAANNTVSYGDWFRFDSGSAYNITAEIRRPGVPGTVEARFAFKAP